MSVLEYTPHVADDVAARELELMSLLQGVNTVQEAERLKAIIYGKIKQLKKVEDEDETRTKYDVALLDLNVPNTVERERINHLLIQLATPLVREKLYVSLSGEIEEFDVANARDILASIYNQLWDEACGNDNLTLEFIVLGSVPCCGLVGKQAALDDPELQAIISGQNDDATVSSETDLAAINAARTANGLGEVTLHSFHETLEELLYRPNSTFDLQGIPSLPQFERVVMGGTFDHMHNGHKRLLTQAAAITTEELVIGITTPSMLTKKKYGDFIDPYEVREGHVIAFLKTIKPSLTVNCVPIDDPFGPAIERADLQAMIVSSETIRGATKTNEIRAERGLPELHIVTTLRSMASTLSSTEIRKWLAQQPQDSEAE